MLTFGKKEVGAGQLEIKGFVPLSLSDWDGKVVSVIFLPHCNLRCPFCYNKNLVLNPERMPTIRLKQVLAYLEENKKWIDGVVITGGEPTLHKDLVDLCKRVKEMGLRVKLDTNGTNSAIVSELIEKKLVDCIALDVKAELTREAYSKASGVDADLFLERIRNTVQMLISGNVEYEFRTTVVPTLHQMTDIEKICDAIKGCRKFTLQNFKSDVETIDPKYQTLKSFSKKEMVQFLEVARKSVPNTIVRG